jgi:signal transduction histidine kinase
VPTTRDERDVESDVESDAVSDNESGDRGIHSNLRTTVHPERQGMLRQAWLSSRGVLPLALVVVALIGSVVIPARQTWLITDLLRETTDLVAPARVLAAQLQSGLAGEIGTLQGYALSGDSTLLVRNRSAVAADDERLARLDNFGDRLDRPIAEHLAIVRKQVEEWRRMSSGLLVRRGGPAELRVAVREAQAQHDATMAAMAALSIDLASSASARDQRLRQLDRLGLIANVVLVCAALVALYGVLLLTLRERLLAASLRRRVAQESARARREGALRQAAEALAGAFTIDDVTERIVHAAVEAVEGRGAYVERIERPSGEPEEVAMVFAVAGAGVPPLGRSRRFTGSPADLALARGLPVMVDAWNDPEHSLMSAASDNSGGGAGTVIVVPLGTGGPFVGALSVLCIRDHVRAEDVARAAICGHLAGLAFEKVRLLDEANEGRRRLERAIASRSRLIRGFSHDVKNPIGAADGYAQLLSDGVYGALSPEQRESIARMRRCMHTALSLIDDLHELARAETGHLALSPEPVDLAGLVADVAEEFHAAAHAGGLAFGAAVDAGVPVIRTSRLRVRQILANLVSNAIKYTNAGSVTLRGTRRTTGPSGDGGDWVALEVADTGRGVAPDKLDFIFEEFGRIGDSGATGAGLGLAISRLLAHALGGQITVVSQPGKGSMFTLWLPVVC